MIIGIDVDGTIVDTVNEWKKWIESKTNKEIDFTKRLNNKDFDFDIDEFWRNIDYLEFKPFSDAEEIINKLSKKHEIIFISDCKKEHIESKKLFLNKYFRNFRFYNTKNKNEIKTDIIIDDNDYILNQIKDNRIKIKPISTLIKTNKYPILSWKEIYNLIEKISKK